MNYRLVVLGLVLLGALVPGVLAVDSWEYSAPGTYIWTCPADMTNATLLLIGGGGGGRAGSTVGGAYYSGEGGKAGDDITVNRIAVVPLTNYTFVIGAGGANSTYGTVSNSGTYSSVFGYSMAGGLGGAVIAASGAGGVGEAGKFSATTWAEAGTGHAPIAGGAAGVGYGAGGGGGSSDGVDTNTIGGFGSAGYVGIWRYGLSGLNAPDFSATPRTGGAGTLVTFTDLSSISNATGLTYNWSFGDGTYSNTFGGVSHVYEYVGSYSPSLTISNGTSTTNTEIKESYINLVYQPSELDLKSEPKAVQFHVQTFWGSPLVGANVSIIGITTSTGNWDWLPLLLGIPLDEVALNNTAMNETTDTLGNVEFLMIPTAKYNVTTTLSGYTFPQFYVSPHDERYTILANINGSGWFESGNNTLDQVNVTVNSTKLSDTLGRINISYYDSGAQTTGGTIYVYTPNATKGGNDVLVTTMPITGNNFTNSTNVTLANEIGDGGSYKVSVEPVRISGSSPIIRTFTVWFKGKTVEFAGFDSTVLMWVALFIIIFTAMFSGATHAPQMAIVVCIEAWIFYAMGWLDPLVYVDFSPLKGISAMGEGVLVILLSFATFVAVAWNFREGKRKEKGT